MIRLLLIASAALPFLRPAIAFGAAQDFVIHSNVRLVLLDVSVKNQAGNPVSGLEASQFRVWENGKPQKITEFSHDDIPVTVGILVDESYSMKPKRAEVITAAGTFIARSNPHDEIFVLNFNDTVRRGLEGSLFSDNVGQLRAALFRGIPEGRTALNDAVLEGLAQLHQGRREKKALILISDGGDNASRHTRREVMEGVERSLATIYAIGLFTEDDPDRDPRLLSHLAHVSGGEAFEPQSVKEMVPICEQIAKDIRARYTVGYVPPDSARSGLRRVHVEAFSAKGHKLKARTRNSYWYESTQGGSAR